MTRRFSWIGMGGVLIAGLAVAGCGGGGSSSSSSSTKSTATAPAITKAELVAKANAICTAGNGPILAAGAQLLTGHPSRAQVAAVVRNTYVPAIESEMASIKALGVPAGEQAVVARMLKLVEAELGKLKRNPALVTTDVFGGFARVAHPYGLVACAPTS
jgi:hypothetical protein